MDAANKSKRRYPAYTLAELKAKVAAGNGNEAVVQEIADREAGLSVPFSTPQIKGGLVIPRIGRL